MSFADARKAGRSPSPCGGKRRSFFGGFSAVHDLHAPAVVDGAHDGLVELGDHAKGVIVRPVDVFGGVKGRLEALAQLLFDPVDVLDRQADLSAGEQPLVHLVDHHVVGVDVNGLEMRVLDPDGHGF